MQRLAEKLALAHQAYHGAHAGLLAASLATTWTAALDQKPPFKDLPPAIVLDLDETVLDTTSSSVQQTSEGLPFPEEVFTQSVDRRNALAIPGAVAFLKFV